MGYIPGFHAIDSLCLLNIVLNLHQRSELWTFDAWRTTQENVHVHWTTNLFDAVSHEFYIKWNESQSKEYSIQGIIICTSSTILNILWTNCLIGNSYLAYIQKGIFDVHRCFNAVSFCYISSEIGRSVSYPRMSGGFRLAQFPSL